MRIEPGYRDFRKVWHEVPRATIAAITEVLGDAAEEGDPPPPQRHPNKVPVPERRMWGFSSQLYATRSKRSWGMGDLRDLRDLGEFAGSLGAGFTLVNPLHAANPGRPQQPSPYFASSRCFMNPLYIAVDEVPGVEAGELSAAGRSLNGRRLIDRDEVWLLKSEALGRAFEAFGGDRDFDAFLAERGPVLEKFATFSTLAEERGARWRRWPASLRDPSAATSKLRGHPRVRYHSWLQWTLDRQLARAAKSKRIVTDLAVGVDPDGADAWIWQHAFAEGMSVGAPPDEFATGGQDWAFAPFDPRRLRECGYEPWVEALRAGFRHSAGLRIDHVMGLFRLWWIPHGVEPRDGAYVRYPHGELLDILAAEAQRAGAFVIGEDLGTVEKEVRRELRARGVLSYRVWWFEQSTTRYPKNALASVSTHDLPTVAGAWSGSDIDAQRAIGLHPNELASARLRRRLAVGRSTTVDEAVLRTYSDLARAPSTLRVASLDDACRVEERPNMPGTVDAWPNWCLALPVAVDDLARASLCAEIASSLNAAPD